MDPKKKVRNEEGAWKHNSVSGFRKLFPSSIRPTRECGMVRSWSDAPMKSFPDDDSDAASSNQTALQGDFLLISSAFPFQFSHSLPLLPSRQKLHPLFQHPPPKGDEKVKRNWRMSNSDVGQTGQSSEGRVQSNKLKLEQQRI